MRALPGCHGGCSECLTATALAPFKSAGLVTADGKRFLCLDSRRERAALPKRERVPDYHYNCPESAALIEALTAASLEVKTAFACMTDQFFVSTATWGLSLWEAQVGIRTDESLSLAVRRAAVQRQLVANGNTTEEMVRELAETMTGYQARVVINDDYSFSLEFLGVRTELVDIDVSEIRAIVEQIKPAHLCFIISGPTWADVESTGLTWQWFEDHPATWEEFEAKFCIHGEE
jgi:hypothetical protein|nr:putative phage tail protein [uncultured Oscillibacter sp.]